MNDSIPVTDTVPQTAPIVDVPAAPAPRGRAASPRTVAIRQLLDASNGEATYAQVKEQLKAQGFEVNSNTFNVTKSAYKRNKNPDAPKTPRTPKTRKSAKRQLPEVTIAEAITYVTEAGGVAKAQANLLRGLACLKAFQKLVKQTSKLAA